MTESGWRWDPTLYAGSAEYYSRGRVPYPPELVTALVSALGLDGSGHLLDVGCGPGSLTLLLAPFFERVTGLDADAGMLAEAARQADAAGVNNAAWLHLRVEELPPDLGPFRTMTLAQSFHWMDRPRVAVILRRALSGDGALVHVHATTHQGIEDDQSLLYPRPPRRDINELVHRFLGPQRRAGQGTLPEASPSEAERGRVEAEIYSNAGFTGPERVEVPGSPVVRTTEQVVASVFSLSSAAPHLFGSRVGEFEWALRDLLGRSSPEGLFSEQMRGIAFDVWRP